MDWLIDSLQVPAAPASIRFIPEQSGGSVAQSPAAPDGPTFTPVKAAPDHFSEFQEHLPQGVVILCEEPDITRPPQHRERNLCLVGLAEGEAHASGGDTDVHEIQHWRDPACMRITPS